MFSQSFWTSEATSSQLNCKHATYNQSRLFPVSDNQAQGLPCLPVSALPFHVTAPAQLHPLSKRCPSVLPAAQPPSLSHLSHRPA